MTVVSRVRTPAARPHIDNGISATTTGTGRNKVTNVTLKLAALERTAKLNRRGNEDETKIGEFPLGRISHDWRINAIVMGKRDGANVPEAAATSIQNERSISGYGPGVGQIISKGTHEYTLRDSMSADAAIVGRFTMNLDKEPAPPAPTDRGPTPGTKTVRDAWKRPYFKQGRFDFEKGVNNGKLTTVELKDAKKLPALKADLAEYTSSVEGNKDSYLKGKVTDGQVMLLRDPTTRTTAFVDYTDGESDHRVRIYDEAGNKVGEFGVADDGTWDWREPIAAPPAWGWN